MWPELHLHLELDLDEGCLRARAYRDALQEDLVEELWWAYRPHCGGLGCLQDYQDHFVQAAVDYFSSRADKLSLGRLDGLSMSQAVRREFFDKAAQNDVT